MKYILQGLFFRPGAARVLVTFSCAAKEKVTKEKAAQFAVPFGDKPALLDR